VDYKPAERVGGAPQDPPETAEVTRLSDTFKNLDLSPAQMKSTIDDPIPAAGSAGADEGLALLQPRASSAAAAGAARQRLRLWRPWICRLVPL
jgi:hypothetical protein